MKNLKSNDEIWPVDKSGKLRPEHNLDPLAKKENFWEFIYFAYFDLEK